MSDLLPPRVTIANFAASGSNLLFRKTDRIFFVLIGVSLVSACMSGGYPRTAGSVNPDFVRAHMEFLADDLLEGRDAGTRGYDLAALYVSSEFRAIGLQPAGTQGYFQPVPLKRSIIVPGSVRLEITGRDVAVFTDRDHVVSYPSFLETDQRISGELAFAGNGVVAPQFGRDDFAGLDVRGKIVVVFGGSPSGIPAEAAAHLSAPATQAERAAERGALGLIVICTPAYQRKLAFEQLGEITRQTRVTWHDPALSPLPGGSRPAMAYVDETAAAALFEGAPVSYAEALAQSEHGPVSGFPLKRGADFRRQSRIDEAISDNVAGLLPGADPSLKDEIIVVTSHLDHIGIGPAVSGDRIYNGAIDNASGIAATLEVARVLKGKRPKRSVLFLAVTGEERGLIGSKYFTRAPTVPFDQIKAVINIDGVMAFYHFESIVGYGAESSTLREPLLRALDQMDLSLMPDPHPEISIYTQSDHYSFVLRGVPAIFLQMGEGPAPDGGSGLALSAAWDAARLHKPNDDLTFPIDYDEFSRFTELYWRFALETADMASPPRWYEGDFFGATFAPDAEKAPSRTEESQ